MKRIHHVGYWQLFPIFNGQLQAPGHYPVFEICSRAEYEKTAV